MTLQSVLVTDTNIWIDLQNGNILAEVFRLPYQFFTTDFSVEEFIHPAWAMLRKLGLKSHELDPKEILELVILHEIYHQLSVIDLAALLLAKALGASLVTGDRRLTDLAKTQGLSVHGVLWVLDEMVLHQVLTTNQAAVALQEMLDHGARLPTDECQTRLENWS